MSSSDRHPHRPVHAVAQTLFARNNHTRTIQPRPVAAPLPSVSSFRPYLWQPRLRAASGPYPQRYQPSSSPGHAPGGYAPPSPFNPQQTGLIRAGYTAQSSTPVETTKKKMAEPRARVARHKGQMNFPSELRLLLLAYGDPSPHPSFPSEPLPETVRVLDEIVTDFILEMCHGAAQYATYSRRQKIKVDDFRFALRRDPNKLGRVQELLRMERELKEARKAFDQNDDQVANLKDASKKGLEDLGEDREATVAGKKSKGKNKRGARRDSDATEETLSKKRKVIN